MSATCSVLVVEDDAAIRMVLTEVLGSEGFQVRSAAHGRDALAILDGWRPSLILTDLNMPVMDGWAFRGELRRRQDLADIPIIVLSAALWDTDKLAGLGALELVSKPCDLDALVAAIRRAVETVENGTLEVFPRMSSHEDAVGGPMVEAPAPRDAER